MSKNRQTYLRPYSPDKKSPPSSVEDADLQELGRRLTGTEGSEKNHALHDFLWKLMKNYMPAERQSIQVSFVNHLEYTLSVSRFSFNDVAAYLATSFSVRDRLIELFNDTMEYFISNKVKQVCYVSIEFLLGRFLRNALLNLELEDLYRDALQELGVCLDQLYPEEYDAALGNGGLGRLAACFLDSMATLNIPGWGYGLMYSFGTFKQIIGEDGEQIEVPDYWLGDVTPWRIQKNTVCHPVYFFGKYDKGIWEPDLTINAIANDFLIPGFATDNTLALRLWSSRPTMDWDEERIKKGDYYEAITSQQKWINLTSILYPNDSTGEGREMKLMQEYLLSSATLTDIVRRIKKKEELELDEMPSVVAIHINDTQPAVMILELLRLLIDVEKYDFGKSFRIVNGVFSYTCHTLMPEALEKWPIDLFQKVLPRHIALAYQLNEFYVHLMPNKSPSFLSKVSIVQDNHLSMAHLAIIGSHAVNGVAKLHTHLMTTQTFKEFAQLQPTKFVNKTNGVSVRRWVHHCNPELTILLDRTIGDDDWVLHPEKLRKLLEKINDPMFYSEWISVKYANKQRLANYIYENTGVELNADLQMFDVQVKRIQEYKRQVLNILYVIDRYLRIKESDDLQKLNFVPRAVIFAGKASPHNKRAKATIALINNVADIINNDESIGDLLKVVFIPNYNVSIAELIMPATDISQHISTAGTEASGTSNMKFAFNGSLLLCTFDGATLEIAEEIGEENVFFFGSKADDFIDENKQLHPRLAEVFQQIRSGMFGENKGFESQIKDIEHGDKYRVSYDYQQYVECQDLVDQTYQDNNKWVEMSINSTAKMGFFSADRSLKEYADEIWTANECKLPQVHAFDDDKAANTISSFGSAGSFRRHHKPSIEREITRSQSIEDTFTRNLSHEEGFDQYSFSCDNIDHIV